MLVNGHATGCHVVALNTRVNDYRIPRQGLISRTCRYTDNVNAQLVLVTIHILRAPQPPDGCPLCHRLPS